MKGAQHTMHCMLALTQSCIHNASQSFSSYMLTQLKSVAALRQLISLHCRNMWMTLH